MSGHGLHNVPVGTQATGNRRERDSRGVVDVPADKYWGPGTQRALRMFPAGPEVLPEQFYRCYGYVKRAAAFVNAQAGRLPGWKTQAIAQAADDLIAGRLAGEFPLPVWQSGSGRDADTNVNEVLANRASQLLGGAIGQQSRVDPAHDVNMAQSLGGMVTAAMYVATVIEIEQALMPRGLALARAFDRNRSVISTHGGRLRAALGRLDEAEGSLHEIAADPDDEATPTIMSLADWQILVGTIAADTARPFILSPDRFCDRGSVDAMVASMAAVRGLAIVLSGICDGLAAMRPSGEHAGLFASIEAIAMICTHAIGQDQVVAATGYRVPHASRPLIVHSVLSSIHRIGQACEALRRLVSRMR